MAVVAGRLVRFFKKRRSALALASERVRNSERAGSARANRDGKTFRAGGARSGLLDGKRFDGGASWPWLSLWDTGLLHNFPKRIRTKNWRMDSRRAEGVAVLEARRADF